MYNHWFLQALLHIAIYISFVSKYYVIDPISRKHELDVQLARKNLTTSYILLIICTFHQESAFQIKYCNESNGLEKLFFFVRLQLRTMQLRTIFSFYNNSLHNKHIIYNHTFDIISLISITYMKYTKQFVLSNFQ